MNDKQLQSIREAVRDEVKITVNGKIDKIKEHLERQDVQLKAMDIKIDDLTEKTLPVVQGLTFLGWARKIVIYLTPLGVLTGIIKWIK